MKISYKDFAYLMNYKLRHPFVKYCCNCYVTEKNANVFLSARVKLPIYILLFIPVHVAEFFLVIFDGGLKNYELWTPAYISFYSFTIYEGKYQKWKKQYGM